MVEALWADSQDISEALEKELARSWALAKTPRRITSILKPFTSCITPRFRPPTCCPNGPGNWRISNWTQCARPWG